MAEALGRLRPDGPPFGRTDRALRSTLPLDAADERTPVEMQVESTKVLASLGANIDLKVDVGIDALTGQSAADYPNVQPQTASGALKFLVSRLLYARDHGNDLHATLGMPPLTNNEIPGLTPDSVWKQTSDFIWAWDAAIQDQLASGDFGTASAYQLGRGLAESYWLLDPTAGADSPRSWQHLLGANRIAALTLICRRLMPSLGTVTAPAVEASLASWAQIAMEPDSYVNPRERLGEQLLVWRDLLLTQRDPTTFVAAKELAKESRRIGPLLKAYWQELFIGGVAAALLGVSLFLLPHLSGAVLAPLSALGLTATGLGTKAKATIQSVGDRVRTELAQDVVNTAVLVMPQHKTSSGILGFGTRTASEETMVPAYRP